MLTMQKASVLLVSFSLTLVGCSDQMNRDVTAPSAAANFEASRSQGAEVSRQRITGHAEFIVTNEGNAAEEYSVEAKPASDQTSPTGFTLARGELEFGSAHDGFRIHGEMYCFKVEGKLANLAARVTKSTNPNVREGDYLVWRIQDDGKGNKKNGDRTTQLFLAPEQASATDFCIFGGDPLHPFFPARGDLVIHEK